MLRVTCASRYPPLQHGAHPHLHMLAMLARLFRQSPLPRLLVPSLQLSRSTSVLAARGKRNPPKTRNMAASPPSQRPKTEHVTIGTHSGNFHCDEALACYMLKKLPEYGDAIIVRSRDPEVTASSTFHLNRKPFIPLYGSALRCWPLAQLSSMSVVFTITPREDTTIISWASTTTTPALPAACFPGKCRQRASCTCTTARESSGARAVLHPPLSKLQPIIYILYTPSAPYAPSAPCPASPLTTRTCQWSSAGSTTS
jgi:hypothetical protein